MINSRQARILGASLLLTTSLYGLIPFDPGVNHLQQGSITLSTDSFDFPQTEVFIQDWVCASDRFTIYNGSDRDITVESVASSRGLFNSPQIFPQHIPAQDSIQVDVIVCPPSDRLYQDVLFVEIAECEQPISIWMTASAVLDIPGYSGTYNLYDEALEDALADLFPNQVDLGYSGARRQMYGYIDNVNDSLYCVYTGFRQHHPEGSTGTFPNPINCEHTWPQGTFDSASPMRGDIHHLFPTHMDANSARGSYPFGDVVSNIQWQNGGSKLGHSSYGQTVFEPRDIHKGDAARAIFYFLNRYQNYENWMSADQEEDLRAWFHADPVSFKELDRNEGIYAVQSNRNPFVDHQPFLDRITSLVDNENRPDSSIMVVTPAYRQIEIVEGSNHEMLFLAVANTGNQAFELTGVSSNNENFTIDVDLPVTVPEFETLLLPLAIGTTAASDSASIQLTSSAIQNSFQEIQVGYQTVVSVDERIVPAGFALAAFPNPFNGTVMFKTPDQEAGTLRIFDLHGREVYSEVVEQGDGNLRWQPEGLEGGVFIVRLEQGGHYHHTKLIYLK